MQGGSASRRFVKHSCSLVKSRRTHQPTIVSLLFVLCLNSSYVCIRFCRYLVSFLLSNSLFLNSSKKAGVLVLQPATLFGGEMSIIHPPNLCLFIFTFSSNMLPWRSYPENDAGC